MSELIFGHDRKVADFVGDRLGVTIHEPFVGIGLLRNGALVGGAVFNQFNGSNIEMTLYAPGIGRGEMKGLIHYVFVQLQCNRATARTKRSNRRACRLLPRYGFVHEAILLHYFGPQTADDAILYRLDREQAMKWLERLNGRTDPAAAA